MVGGKDHALRKGSQFYADWWIEVSHLIHGPTLYTPPKPHRKTPRYIFLKHLYLNNYNSYLYNFFNIAY